MPGGGVPGGGVPGGGVPGVAVRGRRDLSPAQRGRTRGHGNPRGHHLDPAGVQAPARHQLLPGGRRQHDHARRPPGQGPRPRQAMPGPLIRREVAGAQLEAEVLDGEDERNTGREGERDDRRSPHHVGRDAQQPVQARAAAHRRRAEQHPAGQHVAMRHHVERELQLNRTAPRREQMPLVVRMHAGQRSQQFAQIARHPPRAGECSSVHSDPHAARTVHALFTDRLAPVGSTSSRTRS